MSMCRQKRHLFRLGQLRQEIKHRPKLIIGLYTAMIYLAHAISDLQRQHNNGIWV